MELNTIYFMLVDKDKGVFFNTLNAVLFSFLYKQFFFFFFLRSTYFIKHTIHSIISDTDFHLFYKISTSCGGTELKFQQL